MVLFRIPAVFVSAVLMILVLRPVVAEYSTSKDREPAERNVSLASTITGEDARYHYLSGLLAYNVHDRAGIEKSIRDYLLALERNPTDSRTWISLAKAYRDSGSGERALYAARKAAYLDKNNPFTIWEAGVFFLTEGEFGEAARMFRRYIYMVPQEQESVYALCYTMGVEPSYILANIVPRDYDFYRQYLGFLTASKLLKESYDVWDTMKSLNPRKEDFLGYIDFLIRSGDITRAVAQWKDFARSFRLTEGNKELDEYLSEDLLWNGDFELPAENGGFDWRIGKSEEVRIFRDMDIKRTGDTSLSVNFDGTSNPGITVAGQIVPVEPGKRYVLSGYIRTEKITTRNGLVFEVSGFLCDPFVAKTEPVTGTNMWKRIDLEFSTPGTCKAVRVGIKREKSAKFDSKINGDAWIDSLSMTEARGK